MGKICKICGLVAEMIAHITDFATESHDVPDLTHPNPIKYILISKNVNKIHLETKHAGIEIAWQVL